ncbi:MAG: FliH/SctL family protein [Deltaproteobacteria bacterium]
MDGADGERTAGRTTRIAAEVWEARQAARAMLEAAREEAARIRSGAAEEVEGARRSAVEAGREEGLALGLARAAAEVLRGAAERERLLAGCDGELVGLAVEMAERILRREVRADDGIAAAARALAGLRGATRVTLRASPADLESLRGPPGRIVLGEGCVRIVADPGLGPGEVIAEAGGASVDGTFRAQLTELRRAIEEGTP